MEPRRDLSVSAGVDTWRLHVIRVTDSERAVDGIVVRDGVVRASYLIVNVVAERCGVAVIGVAHLEAEHA